MRSMTGRGFTLIEVLIVVAVIATLVGLGLPAYAAARERARVSAARALVATVAAAITAYQRDRLHLWHDPTGVGGGVEAMHRAWDVEADGIIDGHDVDGYFWAPAPPTGDPRREALCYNGFVATVRPELPNWAIEPDTGRVYDPWRRPLRIAFARHTYGSGGFGVWSAGPDGEDAGDEGGDDLRSWERR